MAGGISYGKDSNGNMQDVVFEIVDGRYRFTSVLVGIPVEQYKTEFAFRGYAVLEKNGVQITLRSREGQEHLRFGKGAAGKRLV